MAATNATHNRSRKMLRRSVLLEAMQYYQSQYPARDGGIRATFDVIYMIGWAPHESQQKPLRPGSAANRLAEALQGVEVTAGEKAIP